MLTKMCFILHSVISTDLTKKFQNKYKFELIGIKCLTGDRRSADNVEEDAPVASVSTAPSADVVQLSSSTSVSVSASSSTSAPEGPSAASGPGYFAVFCVVCTCNVIFLEKYFSGNFPENFQVPCQKNMTLNYR